MKSPFARLTLPARVQSVRAFHEFVRGRAETAGLKPADMDKLDLVLEEILVNIARYAYAGGNGDMEVAYAADGDTLIDRPREELQSAGGSPAGSDAGTGGAEAART